MATADASGTSSGGALLQKVGAGTSAGTLGTLIFVGVLARDAFEAQQDATERVGEAIEDVRDLGEQTQEEVAKLKRQLEDIETAGQVQRDELEQRWRAELDELRACVLDRKRCRR